MATAAKRKSLSDDNRFSNPPPTTKRLKGVEYARRANGSRTAHNIITPPKPNKRNASPSMSSSSEPSTGSESDGSTSPSPSALSSPSESIAIASEEEPESEDGSTSPSSSSSSPSSDSSSSSDTTQILNLPIPQKPSITHISPSATTSDLHQRLSTFLPDLAAANQELDVERAAGRLGERNIEAVDDEEYIEMNLGLGVLEEMGRDGEGSGGGSDDGSLGGDDLPGEERDADGGGEQGLQGARGETDVLGKLLRRGKSKVEIQVVDAG